MIIKNIGNLLFYFSNNNSSNSSQVVQSPGTNLATIFTRIFRMLNFFRVGQIIFLKFFTEYKS